MKKTVSTLLALAMFAMVAPGAAASEDISVREENRAWMLDQNPEFDPGEIVEVNHNGMVEQMEAAQALEIALDRAGTTSLENLVSSSAHGTADLVGDIWLIGLGSVSCGTTDVVTESPIPAEAVDPQFFIYEGDIGVNTGSSAAAWVAQSWTMKDSAAGSGAINYGGVSDFFCIEGDFFGLLFPFIDGFTTTQGLPA